MGGKSVEWDASISANDDIDEVCNEDCSTLPFEENKLRLCFKSLSDYWGIYRMTTEESSVGTFVKHTWQDYW